MLMTWSQCLCVPAGAEHGSDVRPRYTDSSVDVMVERLAELDDNFQKKKEEGVVCSCYVYSQIVSTTYSTTVVYFMVFKNIWQ